MPSRTRTCDLAPSAIIADDRIQPRERLNTGLVEDYQGIYTEAAPASAPFPPLEVFEIDGAYYVADGFHRLAAARAAGIPQVRCRVSQGTPRDAMLYAAAANARHGLRYTAGDKARIVQRLLGDAEIAQLSDRAMARRFGLSHTYVSQVRKRQGAERTVAADLATVATRARSPRNKERERLAGILGVPYAEVKAVDTHDPGSLDRLPKAMVRRVARGEDYQAVKAELAHDVRRHAAQAAARAAQNQKRREQATFHAHRHREQQAALAYLTAAGSRLEERLMDLMSPYRLAILLCPLLPADELPTAEELAGMLWRLKQEAADALERVAQHTRRLDTRPKGEVVPVLLRLLAEARRQERDPEEMQRAYPGTFEERQALRSDPHRHRN